jgi:hypothetical protein
MKLAFVLPVVAAAGIGSGCQQQTQPSGLPKWLTAMVAQLPANGTIVEEAVYQGRRTFVVMPRDRPADGGNEHILYSEDGTVICEFGGIGGHVTVGSCDLEAIEYVRTLLPKPSR